jgi:hypothetical protein
MEINDNTFQQAISCPLKLYHIASGTETENRKLPYRHRNKLRLRDAVSLRYQNRRFTSDSIKAAEQETREWLNDEKVAICGAVLRIDRFMTRIPILVKDGSRYTIVQVHGKLRKRVDEEFIQWPVKSRSTSLYLLKAAYRAYVLERSIGGGASEIRTTLFFPDRGFRSSSDNLIQQLASVREEHPAEDVISESEKLFTTVDATEAVNHVIRELPATVSYNYFTGMTVSDACDFIKANPLESSNLLNVNIHNECKYCEFRLASDKKSTGCWAGFFPDKTLRFPALHVHELIGHGNDSDIDRGFFYQEQVPFTEPFTSFDVIKKNGGEKLTIHQRRMLQILRSKGEPVPDLWIKAGISELANIKFPLHFIDFEAATYALPMHRGMNSYQPVYFQYSCHTLFENGFIQHHEWLDDQPQSANVHAELVRKLHEIPFFLTGTIVQYSQFEYRALKNLLKDFKRNAMLYETEIGMLNDIMNGTDGIRGGGRFLDLSRIIEDFYFNRFLQGGIGLKQVLTSVLKWAKTVEGKKKEVIDLHDITIDLMHDYEEYGAPDPYSSIKLNGEKIDDGSVAMNAWLSLKNRLLTDEEIQYIPVLLRRYCALDSYALVVLFRHLKQMMAEMKKNEDLIIFK